MFLSRIDALCVALESLQGLRERHRFRYSPRMRTLALGCWAVLVVGCGSADSGSLNEPVGAEGPATVGPSAAAPAEDTGLVADDPLVGGACSGQVAEDTFASALCSCEDTNVAGYLRTGSYREADAAGELLANVGVNRNYITTGYANIGGSFTVAGPRDVLFGGLLSAGQDLLLQPAADVAGVVDVGRDAWLGNELRAFGRVEITRDLYADGGAGFRGIALVDVGGTRHTQDVAIAPPCACGSGELIDVAALVSEAEQQNDNASIGLEPEELNVVAGIGAQITLPGGRYYVDQIGGIGGVTLNVTGKTALFIGDDLLATGAFRVELAPDAEIDIFVRDNLVITGAARFGDRERPSATRVYVGGTGDVAVAGYAAFVGNLYAPTANILVGGYGQIYGSLFGKNISAAGFLSVGYDAAIQTGGKDCPPAAGEVPRIR